MNFLDEATIFVSGGDGGRGCVAFRREKYVPRGGPDGGNGGDGGDVILQADPGRNTLLSLKGKRHFRAKPGVPGGGKSMHGRCGNDEMIRVPLGTIVRDAKTGRFLADLTKANQQFIAAKGGKGGRGNASFATATNRVPRHAQSGMPGEERTLALELKLLADVGLIGRPNAGKSTLISRISAARPKVADYPFTTLQPNLGVVRTGYDHSFTVADIPGLIEGAHLGAGMGIRFLKHIERTRLFLHLLDLSDPTQSDPWESFVKIEEELKAFSPKFSERTRWVVFSKMDVTENQQGLAEVQEEFAKQGYRTFAISAVTGEGLDTLVRALGAELAKTSLA